MKKTKQLDWRGGEPISHAMTPVGAFAVTKLLDGSYEAVLLLCIIDPAVPPPYMPYRMILGESTTLNKAKILAQKEYERIVNNLILEEVKDE